MIYFLRRANGDIKIGTTINYFGRISALQNKYGKLELLGVHDGNRETEIVLHERFSEHRLYTRNHPTEWFRPVPDLLGYIHQHTHKQVPGADVRQPPQNRVVTHFPEMVLGRFGVKSIQELDVPLISRQSGVRTKIVRTWLTGNIEYIRADQIARFCIWLDCDIGELLTLTES